MHGSKKKFDLILNRLSVSSRIVCKNKAKICLHSNHDEGGPVKRGAWLSIDCQSCGEDLPAGVCMWDSENTLPFCIGGHTLASMPCRNHLNLSSWLYAVVLGIKLKCVLCSWVLAFKQRIDSLVNSPNGAEAKTNIRIFAIPKLEGALRT